MVVVRNNFLCLFLIFLSLSPSSHSITEAEALLQFKASITNAKALDSWTPDTIPCPPLGNAWVGLSCANGQVRTITLFNMGLAGIIDTKPLEQLPGLKFIIMANNSFEGPIPGFNRLADLKAFYISSNKFSGEIPSDYFANMKALKKLWIDNNEFSGKVPESITQLPILRELRLDNNQFSGPIPPLKQKSLADLDMSNNKLEGEIPEYLLKFNSTAFKNNPGLCSAKLGIKCTNAPTPGPGGAVDASDSSKSQSPSEDYNASLGATWVVLVIVIILLALTLYFKSERKEDSFAPLGKENLDEAVQVSIPSPKKTLSSSPRNGMSGSPNLPRKSESSNVGGRLGNDLVVVNDEKGVFGLSDLMKAAAEVLGNGGLGSAYKAMMSNGVSVVVKRIREMNTTSKETFDTEMRRIGALHSEFPSYELPHGNLKSSNVLLGSNYNPLLSDYAMYPLVNTTQSAQAMFAFKSPEAVLYQQISPKSDVYCLGILILEILTGKFPSQYLNNQKGGTDVVQWVRTALSERRESELIDPEIAGASAASLEQMEKLLRIGASCNSNCLQAEDSEKGYGQTQFWQQSLEFQLPLIKFSKRGPTFSWVPNNRTVS